VPDLGSFRDEVHWILEHRMSDCGDHRTICLVAELVGAAVADPDSRTCPLSRSISCPDLIEGAVSGASSGVM